MRYTWVTSQGLSLGTLEEGGEHAAGPLLSRCLHVLMRLTLGYQEKVEHVRTIVVVGLLWSQWYASLPRYYTIHAFLPGSLSCG